MRKIKIYQRDSQQIELFDESDMNFDDYCKELSKLFNISNVSILKTSTQTFIVRPSQITGIVVEEENMDDNSLLIDDINEIDDIDDTPTEENETIPEETPEEEKVEEPKKEEPPQDIITDMD